MDKHKNDSISHDSRLLDEVETPPLLLKLRGVDNVSDDKRRLAHLYCENLAK
jgi:hypothetical protein